MNARCGDCRFYQDGNTECRRRAPRTFLQDKTKWPRVRPDDWCGEFEQRSNAGNRLPAHELIEDELADVFALPHKGPHLRNVLLGFSWYERDENGHMVLDENGGNWKLRIEPIITMRQLLALKPYDLLRQPNFGRRSLDVLEKALKARGLHLAR